MPSGEKPYRVYRGGRVRGKVPSPPPPEGKARRGAGLSLRPNKRWLRWIPVLLGVFLVFVLVWALASYFQFRDGVSAANKRLDRKTAQALDDQHGGPTDILLLGTDHARLAGRESANRSDSITLVRTDPGRHRIVYLSIPRDLVVEIPGYGTSKINAAMQVGGAALAVRTVRELTGLPINHVVIVDFSQVRVGAVNALYGLGAGAAPATPALIKALGDGEANVRWMAANCLGNIGPQAKDAVPALKKALEDKDNNVQNGARVALQRIEGR